MSVTVSGEFETALRHALASCAGNDFSDNVEPRANHAPLPARRRVAGAFRGVLHRLGLYRHRVERNAAALGRLHALLGDEASKRLLVSILAYRILGPRKVRLPTNTQSYAAQVKAIEENRDRSGDGDAAGSPPANLLRFDLRPYGFPLSLLSNALGVHIQFVARQYVLELPDRTITPHPGDVVVDCGGCYGDTAIFFGHLVGDAGHVHSFEFMPSNVEVFRANLALNPDVAPRVDIVERAVWSTSNEKLFIEGTGPSSHVTATPSETARVVETMSIDDLCRDRNIARVDFIKMDIEGAEPDALAGAVATIRAHRPTLAISVYHKIEHFWQIAEFIDSLGLGYRFALGHYTIWEGETILFAYQP